MTLPAQISHRRAHLHLSQNAVAKLAGIRQSHLSAVETGKLDARLSTLNEVARAVHAELVLIPLELLPAVQSLIFGESLGDRRLFNADPD